MKARRLIGASVLATATCATETTLGMRSAEHNRGGHMTSLVASPKRSESRSTKRLFAVSVLVGMYLLFSVGVTSVASAAPNRPEPVDATIDLPAGTVCSFAVDLQLSGKSKTTDLPGNRFLISSPGLHATVTNVDDPDRLVTLSISGASRDFAREGGGVLTVVTGRNLLFDPQAGFVLARGSFRFAFDGEANLVEPLNGKGQLEDVCQMVA